MSDYWITTQWPFPSTDAPFIRHVYVRKPAATLPQPGDTVFFRETRVAMGEHKRRVLVVNQHYRGRVTPGFEVPKGTGGIVGVATVEGLVREQRPDDVVFDFGNLSEWRVVPYRSFRSAALPLADLRDLLGVDGVFFLNLWKMPDGLGPKLLKALRWP